MVWKMTEEFRKYDEHFEVSNLGNVKKDGQLVNQYKDEHYYNVTVYGKPVRVHVMVGKCFPDICGEWHKYYHYHHLNRNQLDNRAENIVCLSPSEHKRLHQLEDGVSKPVKAYNLKGEFVGRWDSIEQAAAATKTDSRHIKNILSGKERRFTANKMYWFLAEEIAGETEEKIFQKILEIQSTKYQRDSKK